jgi:hypothetical protein
MSNIFDPDDDDLYLDNPDDDQELDESDEDDSLQEDDEDLDQGDEPRKGNLTKALQEERAERRKLQEELKRQRALLERLGQPQPQQQYQQQQQYGPSREQLQEMILEHPEQFAEYQAMLSAQRVEQILQRQQSIQSFKSQIPQIVKKDKEAMEIYRNPVMRQAVDTYIDDALGKNSFDSVEELQDFVTEVFDGMKRFGKAFSSAYGSSKDPALSRATSVAGRGSVSSSKSMDAIWENKAKLAKTDPKKYSEWSKSAEGRKVLNHMLQQGLY